MKPITHTAAFLLLPCLAFAQAATPPVVVQDLVPLESGLTYHTPEYHLRLRQVLLRKAGGDDLRFLILESFEPEVLLAVNRTADGWQAQVILPEQQIWELLHKAERQKTNFAEPPCKVVHKALPEAVATRLLGLWRTMLQRTRYPEPDGVTHMDGVSYVFLSFLEGVGHRAGRADNPAAGTRPFLLAEIGRLTVDWVRSAPAAEAQALQQLTVKVTALEAMLAAAEATTAPKDEPARK